MGLGAHHPRAMRPQPIVSQAATLCIPGCNPMCAPAEDHEADADARRGVCEPGLLCDEGGDRAAAHLVRVGVGVGVGVLGLGLGLGLGLRLGLRFG